MNDKDLELLKSHLESHEELLRLWKNHQSFEKSLQKLAKKPFLTDKEKLDKKRIQVDKLNGKTKIESILKGLRLAGK